MSKVLVSENNLSAIADSIRAKNGTQETYTPAEMSTAIDNLPSGGGDTSEYFADSITMTGNSISTNIASILKKIPSNITYSVTSMYNAFIGCSNLESIPLIDTSNVRSFYNAFSGCQKIKTIPLFDTSNVTDMGNMFNNCKSLETIPLLNTANNTAMTNFCNNCQSLETMPLLDTGKVSSMRQCFLGCSKLKNVPLLTTNKILSNGLYYTFYGCDSLTNESLNNILKMCAMATGTGSSYKSLKQVGLTSDQATRCQSLSNYQAFIDAGWTTGY